MPGQLLHLWPAATAALACALLAATAPARSLHLVAWLQLLLLPSTLAWTAAVAVTGVGPSLASVESLTAGAYGEVLGATGLALRTPAFHVVAMLTLSSTLLSFRLARRCSPRRHGAASWLFLALLLPLGMAAHDVRWVSGMSVWIGPEAHVSVPTLFQLGAVRAVLSEVLDNRSGADSAPPRALRDAAAVRVDFRAEPGVAMFLVGESLRHDALLRPGRGPASDKLLARIAAGLG